MTLVIAHRGASWDLPENTLPAFERAAALGADFVELDVHAAQDGTLVVCHDPPRGGEPTLENVVERLRGQIGIMCELKRPARYRRHDVVARAVRVLPEDGVVVSFDSAALQAVTSRRTLQHVGYGVSISRAAAYAWAVGFHDPRFTARGLGKAQRLGLATTVYTVNDAARMRQLAAAGVDGIFTDRPDVLRRVIDAREGSEAAPSRQAFRHGGGRTSLENHGESAENLVDTGRGRFT